MATYDESLIRNALPKAWSLETAAQWTQENPASGQCNVTTVVIHDLFGGDILRTQLPGVWHYYNRINGKRVDFSDSQFGAPGALFEAPAAYDDELTSRDNAMQGIPEREYQTLKAALLLHLREAKSS